jgi:hypothetical protein
LRSVTAARVEPPQHHKLKVFVVGLLVFTRFMAWRFVQPMNIFIADDVHWQARQMPDCRCHLVGLIPYSAAISGWCCT